MVSGTHLGAWTSALPYTASNVPEFVRSFVRSLRLARYRMLECLSKFGIEQFCSPEHFFLYDISDSIPNVSGVESILLLPVPLH